LELFLKLGEKVIYIQQKYLIIISHYIFRR